MRFGCPLVVHLTRASLAPSLVCWRLQLKLVNVTDLTLSAFKGMVIGSVSGLAVVNAAGELVDTISVRDLRGTGVTADDWTALWLSVGGQQRDKAREAQQGRDGQPPLMSRSSVGVCSRVQGGVSQALSLPDTAEADLRHAGGLPPHGHQEGPTPTDTSEHKQRTARGSCQLTRDWRLSVVCRFVRGQMEDGNIHRVFVCETKGDALIPTHCISQRDVLRFLLYLAGLKPTSLADLERAQEVL